MFKWLENLMSKPYENTLKEIETKLQEKPKKNIHKNISEPVLSFVKTVKKTPGRFYVDQWIYPASYSGYSFYYSIIDKKTGDSWTYTDWKFHHPTRETQKIDWMTQDELDFVVKELTVFFNARFERKEKLDKIRQERKNKKERERLIKVYCNE